MSYDAVKQLILTEIDTTLSAVDSTTFDLLVEAIVSARKVFLVGVGRVLLSLKAFTKRLNHLGINAYYVGEINEPPFEETDLLLVASRSGKTLFPLSIAQKAKTLGGKVAYIGSGTSGFLPEQADIFLKIPSFGVNTEESKYRSQQIMTSLFEQSVLLLGDAIAKEILQVKQLNLLDVNRSHANLE